MEVREVVEADLPLLRERQARPDLGLVDEHFGEAKDGELLYAVAIEDGEPLGTALLDFREEVFCPELRNMWVYPNARRRGAGRALSQWAEERAKQAGYQAVYLAVDPNNEKAIPLYVSLEYHPTGEHIFVETPEVPQVEADEEPSEHYAVYKKSLTVS